MRAFGGGGSRESACRRFRDAEGTRRGWNFGRCEPLVRQRDCLPTRVDASRLCGPRDAVVIARSVRHRRPSLSPFRAGKPHPQFLAAGASGERPGLSCVAGSTRCRRWRPRCARRSRARASRSSPGRPGATFPRRSVSSRDPRSRRGASRSRARLGAAPRAHPRAAVPARARRASRALARARDARRFQRAHDALRFARLASADDRARPAARARSSAIAGEGPALARRLLVDARASFAYRAEDGVVTRACAARAAQAWALVCELAASDASGWVPERDATSADLAGAGDILRALVDVDGDDDDVNDDAPVAARAACDSPPDAAFALAAFALPEAWSLAQLTLANADAGGGSHPRDVVRASLSASPLPFAAWRRSARARFVHLPRVDAESRLYAFAARGDVGRGATHTIEDAGVGAGGGAGGGGNDRNSVGKVKLGRRDIPDGRDDLDAPSDASWAVAAEILRRVGRGRGGGGRRAGGRDARAVRLSRRGGVRGRALVPGFFLEARIFRATTRGRRIESAARGSSKLRRPFGRRLEAYVGARRGVGARVHLRGAPDGPRASATPTRRARADPPEGTVRAVQGARAVEARARAGAGRNRRRGPRRSGRPGYPRRSGRPGDARPRGGRGDGGRARALGARPRRRRAAVPRGVPPDADVVGASSSRGCSSRGGGPPKTKSNGSEAFSPNQPGFRAAVEALHREAGRGGDARLGLGDEASERRVRRRLDDVAATAWTSFWTAACRSTGATFAPLRGASRARTRGPSWDPNHPRGVRIRRARAPKRKRGSVPSRTTRWGGRRARWSSRRASSRGTRGRRCPGGTSPRSSRRPPGAPPPRRRPSRRRSRRTRATSPRSSPPRGPSRDGGATNDAGAWTTTRSTRSASETKPKPKSKSPTTQTPTPGRRRPRVGPSPRRFANLWRRSSATRARSRGARVGLGGGRPRGDPRVGTTPRRRRGRRGRGTSFRPRPRLRFRRRRRTRSRRRRRAFSRRASTASSFATRACGRGRGRRRPRRRRRLRSVTRRPRRSEIGPEKLFKVRRRFRRFARRSRTRRGA